MYLYKFECQFLPFFFRTLFYRKQNYCSMFLFGLFNNTAFIKYRFPLKTFFFVFRPFFFFLFFSYWHYFAKNNRIFRSFEKWFLIFNAGYYSRYKVRFSVIGLGNRLLEESWELNNPQHLENQRLVVKLGYSTLLLFYGIGQMKFKKHKRKNAFTVYSSNIFLLANFIYSFRRFRSANYYTGNGIKFLKEKLKLRPRKRWGVI